MARFPPPPSVTRLAEIPPVWHVLPAESLLVRVYFRGGGYPTTWNAFRSFGPTSARFDHHTYPRRSQQRGILYAATSGQTCVAEVFQPTRIIDRVTDDPTIVVFRIDVPLRLLDLSSLWPTAAGASMAINSGSHARAREWSRAIYAAYPAAQGLWYCSSMDANAPCVALYERAAPAMPRLPVFNSPLADPRLRASLYRWANALNYQLI